MYITTINPRSPGLSWLVGDDICAATGGAISTRAVVAGETAAVGPSATEQAGVVISGSGTLRCADAVHALRRGSVVRPETGARYELSSPEGDLTLLTFHGGPANHESAPVDPLPLSGHVEVFDVDDAEEHAFHNPDAGFFHMSARWLVDESHGGSAAFTLGQSTFEADRGAHELHRHPGAEEVFYVWEGSGVHLAEDGEHPMRAGDLVFVPRNKWHGFRNTSTVPLRAFFGYLGANSLACGGYEMPHH